MVHRVFKRELASLAVRTGKGSCNAVLLEDAIEGLLLLRVDSITGVTPTLDLTFEVLGSEGHWHKHTAFPETYTSTGDKDAVPISNFGQFGRISWDIGGSDTPSFKFEVLFIGKT